MEKDLNPAGLNRLSFIFTSKEVEDYKFAIGNTVPPEPTKCKYCGKTLYYEAFCLNGAVMKWNTEFPQRCDCKRAVAFWEDYDAKQEKKRINKNKPRLPKKSGKHS